MAYQRGAHALAIHYGYGKLRNIEHLYIVESIAYAGRFAGQGARKGKPQISFNTNLAFDKVSTLPELQTEYGQGNERRQTGR